jgi:LysR family transcriptional activator of nhaA
VKWLNYHHLYYFWCVAREGTIARACAHLHLTQPTISGQLRSLQNALGVELFGRAGRHLALTDAGRTVFRFADEIFSLGRDLQSTLAGRPAGQSPRLLVGVADTVPKQIAFRLLQPALRLPEAVQIVCENGPLDSLLARLGVNALDVVLADAPVHPTTKIRAFSHPLGECGVSLWGTAKLATACRSGFPRSLDGAPFLLPFPNTALRRSLDQWFDAEGIRPRVCGEFADPGLLKEFGRAGVGIFAVRTAVENETKQQYGVRLVGRVPSIRERFYAISVERKLKHPAVVAITETARRRLFARE